MPPPWACAASGRVTLPSGRVSVSCVALPGSDKFKVTVEKAPNIGIVTAYNDMLSAHQPCLPP